MGNDSGQVVKFVTEWGQMVREAQHKSKVLDLYRSTLESIGFTEIEQVDGKLNARHGNTYYVGIFALYVSYGESGAEPDFTMSYDLKRNKTF